MTDMLDPNYELPETAQRHKEEMTLTERADAIISQPSYTDDDINELHKIKREMTKLYAHANDMATCAEHNYNLVRASLSWEGAVTAQEAIAKKEAEEKYGAFRNIKASAQGIMAKIKAIESICIQYNVTQKGMRDASMTQSDF